MDSDSDQETADGHKRVKIHCITVNVCFLVDLKYVDLALIMQGPSN